MSILRVIAKKVNEVMVLAEDPHDGDGCIDRCEEALQELWTLMGEYNGIFEHGKDLRH